MAKITIDSVSTLMYQVLVEAGVSCEGARIITDTAIYANKRGIPTHGIGRLPLYIKNLRSDSISKEMPMLVKDELATALYDAQNGFGQVASYVAMTKAIEKAKEYGISIVGVRNSNNFGTAAYYGEMATKEGMFALVMTNSSPAMAPTGGKKAILGTNPICMAVPGGSEGIPVILDMATTVVARGKIRLAAKQGTEIPDDWAIDSEGNATTNPNEALKGTLLPIGSYKGFGLSLFMDIIAGLVMGAAFGGNVKPLSCLEENSSSGHAFIVVDMKKFINENEFTEKMDYLIHELRECGENGAVTFPGERSANRALNIGDDIEVPQIQIDEINRILEEYSISKIELEEN